MSFRHFALSLSLHTKEKHARTQHINGKKLFFEVSKFQQNLKRSTHHIFRGDNLPQCAFVYNCI